MTDDKKKTTFALALTQKGGVQKEGGLSGALARAGGTTDIARPQTSNVAKITGVLQATQKTVQVAQNDHERDMQNRNGVTFVIDATGSREPSWREAQQMQGQMFDKMKEFPRALPLSVICHRGGKVNHLGSFNDAQTAKSKMADVNCSMGETKIVPALYEALKGSNGKPPTLIIMVGDAFEEEMYELEAVAQKAKENRVKIYAFIEGPDTKGNRAYQRAAEITGGIFKRFGEDFDGAGLADLCVAAATLDLGGIDALKKLVHAGDKGAKALLLEVDRKQLGGPSTAPKRPGA